LTSRESFANQGAANLICFTAAVGNGKKKETEFRGSLI
jgi:hypothetical protein